MTTGVGGIPERARLLHVRREPDRERVVADQPRAEVVVSTGAPRRRARAATAAPAASATAPPPAQTSGRRAAAKARAAAPGSPVATAARLDRPGASDGAGRARAGGTATRRRSAGTCSQTGRPGGSSASAQARRARSRSSPASRASSTAFVTGRAMPAWSTPACSDMRSGAPGGERRVEGTSLATTTTGDRDAQASPSAPRVFAAPGPVVTSATPVRPLARANPSAA